MSADNIKRTDEESRAGQEEWRNRPNYSVPNKEKLFEHTPSFVQNKVAWYATRAILQQVQKSKMPSAYMIDLAQDFAIIYRESLMQFIYCIRDSGTHLIYSTEDKKAIKSVQQAFGSECHWFTFDVNDIRNKDDYSEPQLRSCTAEEAEAFFAKMKSLTSETKIEPGPDSTESPIRLNLS